MSSRVLAAGLAAAIGASSVLGVSFHGAARSARAFVARAAGLDVAASDGLPLGTPSTVGMSAERLATVTRVV